MPHDMLKMAMAVAELALPLDTTFEGLDSFAPGASVKMRPRIGPVMEDLMPDEPKAEDQEKDEQKKDETGDAKQADQDQSKGDTNKASEK